MEQLSSRIRLILTVILIGLVSTLAEFNFFLHGTTIFHINAVTSSPMLFMYLQWNNFKDLLFYPQYWTTNVATGIPIHTGLGLYNPLLIPLLGFKDFTTAIIGYILMLRIIGGLGLYLLLRKLSFSWAIATCLSLIYPLSPYVSGYGYDLAFIASFFLIPWLLLSVEAIFAALDKRLSSLFYSLLLGVLLSVQYLSGNVQTYLFVNLFLIAPYTFLRTDEILQQIPSRQSRVKTISRLMANLVLAVSANILLISFEIVPTIHLLLNGDRLAGNSQLLAYPIMLGAVAYGVQILFNNRSMIFRWVLVGLLAVLTFGTTPLAVKLYIPRDTFIFDFRTTRYFITLLQFPLIAFYLLRVRTILTGPRLTLFNIAIAYLAIQIVFAFAESCSDQLIGGAILTVLKRILPNTDGLVLFDHYRRCAFIPFVGLAIALGCSIEALQRSIKKSVPPLRDPDSCIDPI